VRLAALNLRRSQGVDPECPGSETVISENLRFSHKFMSLLLSA